MPDATLLIALLAATAAAPPAPEPLDPRSAPSPDSLRGRGVKAISEEVNAALRLQRSTVVAVGVAECTDGTIVATVPIGGVCLTLDLKPHSVRSGKYRVLVEQGGGSLVPVEPEPVRTSRGVVREVPGSAVAASTLDGRLYATIDVGGGRYWVEPLVHRVEGAGVNDYVVYRDDDVIANGARCTVRDVVDVKPIGQPEAQSGVATGPCASGMYIAELACDADYEYFLAYGSVGAVEDRINAIINTVNLQYESEVGITHAITTIIVRTAEPDPYPSAYGLIEAFQQEWITNQAAVPRDVAHLFTGKEGGAGVAWTIGAICDFYQHYCVAFSDCCGGFACVTDITAHELGHLWGADHCPCASPPSTMNFYLTCANHFHPSYSVPFIVAHRDSRICLDCGPDPCPSDVNDDGAVGIIDMIILLGNWGPNPGNPADLDGDGLVGILDFLQLLAQWGPCP